VWRSLHAPGSAALANFRDGYENVAFSMPGGEEPCTASTRPIDLQHLSAQTQNDRDVESEVLSMFIEQAHLAVKQMQTADTSERLFLAHALKGSALSVGANPIADCIAALEKAPDDPAILRRLASLVEEAADFIASIDR
jgi:HPt (histidine-containing phosphotransfer) domain-containing protein